ncbi:MAG: hypothetical protein ACOX24_03255 [Christensenellales bacterium]|jgi:vacuolar-type H+-ATPase subunit H|nr:hypothetical protein [Clostridiales bacterium]
MIKETLNKILSAEQEATYIVEQALEEAKKVNLEALEEAKKIIDIGKEDIALQRQKSIEVAKVDAEKEREHILKIGKTASEKIKKDTNTQKATESIINAFLEKYS